MTVGEVVKCRCGVRMVMSRGAYTCENCDQVQPHEVAPYGMERTITPQDIRYNMYWESVFNNEYVDNTKNKELVCEACKVEGDHKCPFTAGCPCCISTAEYIKKNGGTP